MSLEQIAVDAEGQNRVPFLVAQMKKGDRAAFMEITRLYQKKVFLLAYSYFRNKEDALDIVQETFLRLYQKADMFQTEKNFQTWLLQIAKNLCTDYYRKNYSRRNQQSDQNLDKVTALAQRSNDFRSSGDLKKAFTECLDQLTDKQRLVFVMRHYNNFEYKEIAQILRIKVGTVKSLHFKAVQNLKALMIPFMGEHT